jgi:hypothetical protein
VTPTVMRRYVMTTGNPPPSMPQRSNTYCTSLSLLLCQHTTKAHGFRRMERLGMHYAALSVELLFKHHPRLEEYLAERYDDKLVTTVCLSSYSHTSLAPCTDHHTRSALGCRNSTSGGSHQLHSTGGPPLPSTIKQREPWLHHTSRPVH